MRTWDGGNLHMKNSAVSVWMHTLIRIRTSEMNSNNSFHHIWSKCTKCTACTHAHTHNEKNNSNIYSASEYVSSSTITKRTKYTYYYYTYVHTHMRACVRAYVRTSMWNEIKLKEREWAEWKQQTTTTYITIKIGSVSFFVWSHSCSLSLPPLNSLFVAVVLFIFVIRRSLRR